MTDEEQEDTRVWREFLPDEVRWDEDKPYVMVELQVPVPVRLHKVDEQGNTIGYVAQNTAPPVDKWMRPDFGAAQVLSIARRGYWELNESNGVSSVSNEDIQRQLDDWARFWLFDKLDLRYISPVVRVTEQQYNELMEFKGQ